MHGNVLHADAIVHGWQHEAHGASQHVQANLGLNQQQADNVQAELQGQMQVDPAEGWDDWEKIIRVKMNLRFNNFLLPQLRLLISSKTLSLLINLDQQQNTSEQLALISPSQLKKCSVAFSLEHPHHQRLTL